MSTLALISASINGVAKGQVHNIAKKSEHSPSLAVAATTAVTKACTSATTSEEDSPRAISSLVAIGVADAKVKKPRIAKKGTMSLEKNMLGCGGEKQGEFE